MFNLKITYSSFIKNKSNLMRIMKKYEFSLFLKLPITALVEIWKN